MTWEEVHKYTDRFIQKFLLKKNNHSDDLWDPNDTDIIAIGRGGLIPAQLIAYGLNVRRVHSLGLSYYEKDNIGGKRKMPIFYQGITTKLNNKILVVDDITDTGSTFLHAINYLKLITNVSAPNFRTFALLTRYNSTFGVDYRGAIVEDRIWVNFPWDKVDKK